MKLASISVAVLVILVGIAVVAGDGGSQPTPPNPRDQAPLVLEQYAVLPVTGQEVIEAMFADEKAGDANALPRDRHSRGWRSPEDQARGLSGSA